MLSILSPPKTNQRNKMERNPENDMIYQVIKRFYRETKSLDVLEIHQHLLESYAFRVDTEAIKSRVYELKNSKDYKNYIDQD